MAISKVVFGGDTLMDITDSTVSEDSLLDGFTAYGADGEKVVGGVKLATKLSELENDAGFITGDIIVVSSDEPDSEETKVWIKDSDNEEIELLTPSDLEDYATKEYVDNHTGGNDTQADWNQNNEENPAYIKNRTHWIEEDDGEYIVEPQTANFSLDEDAIVTELSNDMRFSSRADLPDTIIVIIDDNEYRCDKYKAMPLAGGGAIAVQRYYSDSNVFAMIRIFQYNTEVIGITTIHINEETEEQSHEVAVKYVQKEYHPLDYRFVNTRQIKDVIAGDKINAPWNDEENGYDTYPPDDKTNVYLGLNSEGDYGWHDLPTQVTDDHINDLIDAKGFLTLDTLPKYDGGVR